jgi:pseudouridine-5'-monophosphatase
MPSDHAITHVIYDMDGVLLDTECFYTQVSQVIAGRYGKTFDWSVKSKMIGLRSSDSARILTETLDLPISPDEYLRQRAEMLVELFPRAEPMPGAERLTRHLHRHHIPQAVATSSDRRYFELKTSRHRDWFGLFDCLVVGDDPDVHFGKPAPDIFLVAAGRLRAQPSQCLVFEDSPAGVEAALAAGMKVIAIPDPNMNPNRYPGAHQILSGLGAFDPSSWGLPPMIS